MWEWFFCFPAHLKRQLGRCPLFLTCETPTFKLGPVFFARYKTLINYNFVFLFNWWHNFVFLTTGDKSFNLLLSERRPPWMVSGGGGIPSNRKRVNLILSFSHKGTDERKDARVEKTKEGKSAVNLYASRQRSKSAKSQIHHTLTLSHSHALTLSRSWARSTFSIQCCRKKTHLALEGFKLSGLFIELSSFYSCTCRWRTWLIIATV